MLAESRFRFFPTMEPATTTPQAPVRGQRADARRNHKRVIEAARRCMAREGLDAQMEDVARRAGVGVGTVYRHFRTKEELVEALADDRFDRLRELAEESLAMEDPWDAFEYFVRASARIQTEDRALSEVLTSRPGTMGRAAQRVGMLELVGELLGRAQAAGSVRKDAHPRDIPMLMCALAGTFRNPMAEPDRYIGIALDGLRAGPGVHTKLPPVPRS
jgi:AcrR family transcriptional regulator